MTTKSNPIETSLKVLILLPLLVLFAPASAQAQFVVELVKDINPGGANGASQIEGRSAELNGEFYFAAQEPTTGIELWKTDGTAAGTVLVKDIVPGSGFPGSSFVGGFFEFGGKLFFGADDRGATGMELWTTDGTTAGTVLFKDINPGPGDSRADWFTELNGELFFKATNGYPPGEELWKTDGTAAGTVLVKDINPGSGNFLKSSFPGQFTEVGGELFLRAKSDAAGWELWKTDGTTAATVLVKDINPGTADSNVFGLVELGGELLFSADDGTAGSELWKTDGTAAGTVLLKDIRPGTLGSGPRDLIAFGGQVLFSANDGVSGNELWQSDGTAAGTVLLADINPGAAHSGPEEFVLAPGQLFFIADDDVNGSELWVVRAQTPAEMIADMITLVESLGLPNGLENALVSKLENALDNLAAGNTGAAINQLQAFGNQVEAQAGNQISIEDAELLAAVVESLVADLTPCPCLDVSEFAAVLEGPSFCGFDLDRVFLATPAGQVSAATTGAAQCLWHDSAGSTLADPTISVDEAASCKQKLRQAADDAGLVCLDISV